MDVYNQHKRESSVIRKKVESQNECYNKTKHTKFSEKGIFLTTFFTRNVRIKR